MVATLLRFDFYYADLIRWLNGESMDAQGIWGFSFAIAAAVTGAAILPMGLRFVWLGICVAWWWTKRVFTGYPTSLSTGKSSIWPLNMLCKATVGLCLESGVDVQAIGGI
jgi:hypothetical protein